MSGTTRGERTRDCLLIAGVVFAAAACYLPWLGFHSDDWAMLWYLRQGGPEHGFADVMERSFFSNSIMTRPAFALYAGLLYWAFGLEPLPHHLVNTAVIATGAALLYLALGALRQPRAIAFAVAVVYALLPHYATDRFWWICIQVPLAMAAYFLVVLADLEAAALPAGSRWRWRALSVAALLVAVMSYEIVMPMLLLVPLLAWHRERLDGRGAGAWRRIAPFAALQLALLVAAGLFKASVTVRLHEATLAEHLSWFARFMGEAVYTILAGDFGWRLPAVVADVARYPGSAALFAVAAGCAAAVFLRLQRLDGPAASGAAGRRALWPLAVAAPLLFLAGYAIFFATFMAAAPTTGVNNRTAMGAATGIALAVVVAACWLATWLPSAAARRRAFAALVATACGVAVVVNGALGLAWGTAAAQQRVVLDRLVAAVPEPAAGTTYLLDGACPYVGPAPVFEAWWDLTGAWNLRIGANAVSADVVSPRIGIGEDGLSTLIYDERRGPHPWGSVVVVEAASGVARRLDGPLAAREYFATSPVLAGGCRPSQAGEGERLFVPGARRLAWPPRAPAE